jgi:hypothetical protein
MDAARIDVEKQPTLMQRVAATLRRNGTLHPSNVEVEIAVNLAKLGVMTTGDHQNQSGAFLVEAIISMVILMWLLAVAVLWI